MRSKPFLIAALLTVSSLVIAQEVDKSCPNGAQRPKRGRRMAVVESIEEGALTVKGPDGEARTILCGDA